MLVCLRRFSVSLLFDYLCSDNQNIDEDFENDLPFDGLGRPKTSMLMYAFKQHILWGVISARDNDCRRFYISKTTNPMIVL